MSGQRVVCVCWGSGGGRGGRRVERHGALEGVACAAGAEGGPGRGEEVCARKARLAVRTALENTRAVTEVVVVDLDVDVDVVNG